MTDEPNHEPPRGIFDSLRALVDTVLSILHNRAELFTTEIKEELTRLFGVGLWGVASVLAAIIGVTFVSVTVVLVVPAPARPWVAGGTAALCLGFAAFGLLAIRRIARAKPRPFDASLRELEKDRDRLRGRK